MSTNRREALAVQGAESGAGSYEVETLRLSGQGMSGLLQAVLARGAPFTFRAAGGSLFPFIRDGDLITVSGLQGRPAQLGEVVACAVLPGGKLVVHRVVGRRAQGCLIRGDAALRADGWVDRERILGRVTRIIRGGKERSLGLGRERVLIAALTRSGLVPGAIFPLARCIRAISRCPRASSSTDRPN
jgi:hypothetical protein